MKVINSKLAAIGLAAFVFASCSDSTSDNGGAISPAITPADLSEITLEENSASSLLDRVVTYKNSTANARKFFSRAAGETNFINAMPTDFPTTEEKFKAEAKKVTAKVTTLNNPETIKAGEYYIVNGAVDLTGQNLQGAKIYVRNGKTLKYDKTAGKNTIILETTAHLEYTGTGNMFEEGDVVYITSPKNVISAKNDLKINGTVYANLRGTTESGKALATGLGAIKEADETGKNITPTQKVTFGPKAQVYVNGSIRATELNIEEGANVHTTANVFDAAGTANIKGNLKVDGFLLASTLNVDGNLVAGEKSAIKVTGTMNANAGSKIVADYINVTNNPKDAEGNQQKDDKGNTIAGEATLNLKGDCEITINNRSVINVNNLVTDNASRGQIKLTDNNAVAVIKADNFTNNGAERINAFATSGDNSVFLLQFTKSNNGSTTLASFEDLDIAASYLDYDKATNGKGVTYKDEANKNYGYQWGGAEEDIKKTPKLDLVAAVATPSENLSATCIQKSGNYLYVSYHTNGDKVSSGDVEVAQIVGKNVEIKQSVKTTSTATDYNHLIVDGGHVYVVGNIRKSNADTGVAGVGAFLGDFTLDPSTGKYQTKLKVNPIDKNVQKVDANCVAKYGDNLVVATSAGYEVFNSNFNHYSVASGVNAKHVVVANKNLYAVDLNGGGELKTFTSTDMESPATKSIGEITPTNGKNTIFVDGTDVYVCKGANGLVKIDANGNQTQVYECKTITAGDKAGQVKGNCNGVAVDSKYIYIACGAYGLVVLDKATGNELCHRRAEWGNSANYVTLDGENICVAYGKSRIQVFKVTETVNN